jgi:hypothetical protein
MRELFLGGGLAALRSELSPAVAAIVATSGAGHV